MFRLDLTLPTLAENLALDEALLLDAQDGGPAVLRYWEWPAPAVVVGAGGVLAEEVHLERCAMDAVPIARRGSGGGTVVLGQGCLLYSLVLPMNSYPALGDLSASYRHIMGRLAAALNAEVPGIAPAGISDLAWHDCKFSGNAQQRKRTHLLHHGTILVGFDLANINRYVKHPPRMPDYRRDRPHEDFVVNLPLEIERVKEVVAASWNAAATQVHWPQERVRKLVAEKYGLDDWLKRR